MEIYNLTQVWLVKKAMSQAALCFQSFRWFLQVIILKNCCAALTVFWEKVLKLVIYFSEAGKNLLALDFFQDQDNKNILRIISACRKY
jgi:hypothetical protein